MLEKTLDDILRVSRRIAATTEECVKRWPVNFAKSGERFPRRLIRLRPARLQYDCPVRRLERRTTLLQCSGNRFRRLVIISSRKRFYDEKQTLPKEHAGADIDVVHVVRSHDASRCHSLTWRRNERD